MEGFSFRTHVQPVGVEGFNMTFPMGSAHNEAEARALFEKVLSEIPQPADAVRFELIHQREDGSEEILVTKFAPTSAPS